MFKKYGWLWEGFRFHHLLLFWLEVWAGLWHWSADTEQQLISCLVPLSTRPDLLGFPHPAHSLQCAAPWPALTSAGLSLLLSTSPCPGVESVPVLLICQAPLLQFGLSRISLLNVKNHQKFSSALCLTHQSHCLSYGVTHSLPSKSCPLWDQ